MHIYVGLILCIHNVCILYVCVFGYTYTQRCIMLILLSYVEKILGTKKKIKEKEIENTYLF